MSNWFTKFLAMLGLGRTSPQHNPQITTLFTVANLQQFTAGLKKAALSPNTTIRFLADITSPDTLIVQGIGTVIDLNGHTFSYDGHYDGTTGGCGLLITPTLTTSVPISKGKKAILCNENGSVAQINIALGGDPASWFAEPAPVQYADQPLRDTYTLQRNILVPAENITLKNGKVVCTDPQAFRGAYIEWARNVTFQKLAFSYPGTILDNIETGATYGDSISFIDCDLGGHNLAFNSSYNVTVKGCTNGDITFEEHTRIVTVESCNVKFIRINDATCGEFDIYGNTLTNPDANFGCLVLAGISGGNRIHHNTLTGCGIMWLGMLGNRGKIDVYANQGYDFFKYGDVTRGMIFEIGNTWANRKDLVVHGP